MNLSEQIAAYTPCCEQEKADKELMLRCITLFPDTILTRENPMAHMTASAWCVTRDRKKALMIYHNIYRSWSWTGGHADGESDLLQVALRELREESGLETLSPVTDQIYSLEILGVDPHIKRGRFVSAHLHLNVTYLIEADEHEMLRIKPDENSGVAWFGLDEAVSRSAEPEMQVIYRKLNEKLSQF